MKSVAIGTASDQCWVSQVFNLSVVAFFIRLTGNDKAVVPCHHLLIGMTFLTDLGVKKASKLDPFGLIARQDRCLVEFVAIRTVGGISVPGNHCLSVNTLQVAIILVAHGAFLDDPDFIAPPRGNLVNLGVAVLALDIINKMGTGIVLDAFNLVTPMTGHGFSLNRAPFDSVLFDVGDIPMAAVA